MQIKLQYKSPGIKSETLQFDLHYLRNSNPFQTVMQIESQNENSSRYEFSKLKQQKHQIQNNETSI